MHKAKTIPARHAPAQAFQERQRAGLVVQAIANLLGSWRVPSEGRASISCGQPYKSSNREGTAMIMLSGDRPEDSRTLGFRDGTAQGC